MLNIQPVKPLPTMIEPDSANKIYKTTQKVTSILMRKKIDKNF